MNPQNYLAFDLGASGGRAILGSFNGNRLTLKEIHRFPNAMIRVHNHLHWDVLRLYDELLNGLSASVKDGVRPVSVGVDTWGVDFALIGKDGTLLGNPYAYRDPHTEGIMDWAFTRMSKEQIFECTGIQFMPINTLYHLIALAESHSPLLEKAECFLMMADLFHFFLTGVKSVEFTNATTTQCYNPRARSWDRTLLDTFHIPTSIMPDTVAPGTTLGPLLPHIADEVGLPGVPVVAPATHDTGSAVAAAPAQGEDWAYLSSGTWSLMGIESPDPIISPEALRFNMTNEGGVNGTLRILKNIAGLWLIQECRRIWTRDGVSLSYDDIVREAAASAPFAAFVDPDDPAFLNPPDMPEALRSACERTGQTPPSGRGAIARLVFESLALKYRLVLDQLNMLRGRPVQTLHIVGGGTQNRLLCQFTASAAGIPALAGPVEATAIGNVMVQAMTAGAVDGLSQIREVVRRSFPVEMYTPQDRDAWETAYRKYLKLYG